MDPLLIKIILKINSVAFISSLISVSIVPKEWRILVITYLFLLVNLSIAFGYNGKKKQSEQ